MSLDLNEMRDLCSQATEGPWVMETMRHVYVGNRADGRTSGLWSIVHTSDDDLSDLTEAARDRVMNDAAFIAAARTAVPALLDALAERDAEVERLRERERTLIRVKDADLDDLRHEIDARDALITDIAKIAASAEARVRAVEAVASEHWDWKAGRSLHAAIRAALATPEPTVQAWPQEDS